jgi:hypothetical protein
MWTPGLALHGSQNGLGLLAALKTPKSLAKR